MISNLQASRSEFIAFAVVSFRVKSKALFCGVNWSNKHKCTVSSFFAFTPQKKATTLPLLNPQTNLPNKKIKVKKKVCFFSKLNYF